MPTIIKTDTGRWRAQVRRAGHKHIARTFDGKREAQEWARTIEGGLDKASPRIADDRVTVTDLVRQYRLMRLESGRPIEPKHNEHYMLQHLDEDLGVERVVELTPQRMLQWASYRRRQGAGPYTVLMELSKLGTVIRYVASYLSMILPDVVGSARPLLAGMQMTGGASARARRPTEDEIDSLIAHFADRPLIQDAIRFSVITGLRRGELVKLRRADVLDKDKAVIVRMRKHPRSTQRRDEVVPVLGESWQILQRRALHDDRLFPIEAGYLSKLFKRACDVLGIVDLRWHDLRHEASSRLRDLGFEAIERQAILGHATEKMNARYTHVKLSDLHAKYDAR